MNERPFSTVSLFLFLSVSFLVAENKPAPYPNQWFFYQKGPVRESMDALVGKPMPKLELSGWLGEVVGPESMKGKILVLDFWATWCRPCIQAIPHNNEISSKYKNKGVVVIGVCTTTGQEDLPKVAEFVKINYPCARDSKVSAPKDWNLQFYPTYAVVDREGKVHAIGLLPTAVEKVVDDLLRTEKTQTPSR